jgi:Domain of unknown function (DUF4350)
MQDFKKLVKQYWQFVLLAVIAIVLFTVVSATGGDPKQPGSSYSIAANGYGAWYQMMLDRGVKIQRWEQTFDELTEVPGYEKGVTLLQVNSQLAPFQLSPAQQEWVEQGNTIVILGVAAPAWGIPFQTDIDSPQGAIRIETTRRFKGTQLGLSSEPVLSDRSGNVITQSNFGKGRVITATTPHLAANAYQDFKPNYELLAQLVTTDRQQIIVDEFIHGYRSRSTKAETKAGDVLAYLFRTPLVIVLLNLTLGMLVLIWQQNQRFGKVIIPKVPEIENSEAYIKALGGVLQQANSSEFAIQNIGKAQQLVWQQKLGLGSDRLVEANTVIAAWENQIKLPTDDLRFVLPLVTEARRLNPKELNVWLSKVQMISSQIQ